MADPEKRPKTAIIYARVTPEVKAMLEVQAKAQGRSLTHSLELLARQQSPQERQPSLANVH